MIQPIPMPKLGQTMEEATIEKWHVKEGDIIKKGDILLEITTDKATIEVESFYEGEIKKIIRKEGEVVPVNEVIAYIGDPQDKFDESILSSLQQSSQTQTKKEDSSFMEEGKKSDIEVSVDTSSSAIERPSSKIFASPRARRLAKEHRVPLSVIKGTGPNGRIVEKDVLEYINSISDKKISPVARNLAYIKNIDLKSISTSKDIITKEDIQKEILKETSLQSYGDKELITPSVMRKIIAHRMIASVQSIPQFSINTTVEATGIINYREIAKSRGKKISINDILVKAVAMAIKKFPVFTHLYTMEDKIIVRKDINIGIAISVEGGLLVGVIKNADTLTIEEISEYSISLINKARSGKILPEECTGSIFTISNLGMFDVVESFRAIINPQDSGILAVGTIKKMPVVIDDAILIKPMMKLTLTCDHRTIDGVDAAKFLEEIRNFLISLS